MSCNVIAPGVIVCGSMGNPNCIRYMHCPTCNVRRRFLQHYAGLSYGHDVTCLTCGDQWQDGERRGGRKERVEHARGLPVVTVAEYWRYCREDSDAYSTWEDAAS
jgi:hypothetical protein